MSVATLPFPPQYTTRRPFRLSLVLAARAAFHDHSDRSSLSSEIRYENSKLLSTGGLQPMYIKLETCWGSGREELGPPRPS